MVIVDMLTLERAVHLRCTPGPLPLSDEQTFNRRKCVRFLQDLVAAAVLPPHSADFPLRPLDFAQTLSDRRDNDIHIFDVLPLAAAVYIFIKTDPGRAQVPRHTGPLADLLAAIAGLLARRQRHNAPIQQITRAEFHILGGLNNELATPTPVAWTKIFERRQLLWGEQPYSLTVRIPETYLQNHSFSTNSRASQFGASAWFISVAFWVCLELVGARQRCHNVTSHLPWLCVTQHSFCVLCMSLPAYITLWRCA